MDRRQIPAGKRVLYFFLGFLPVLAAVAIQFAVSLPVTGISFLFSFLGQDGGPFGSNAELLGAISLVYAVVAAVLFGLWYRGGFKRDLAGVRGERFHIALLGGLFFLAIGMQYVSQIIVNLTELAWPGAVEAYQELTEAAGFDSPTVSILLYGVLIGPLAEEMIFRGVTLHYFKRAVPFWIANLLQAALFGLYHMNLLQGVYAGCLGLIFGAVCEGGRSIWYSVLLHIIYNLFGFTQALGAGSGSRACFYLWPPVMVVCLVMAKVLFFERVEAERH